MLTLQTSKQPIGRTENALSVSGTVPRRSVEFFARKGTVVRVVGTNRRGSE